MYSSYNEIIDDYIQGKSDTIYLYACLDFAYYCSLMNKQHPLEEVQLVWQHCYDLAKFNAETMSNPKASKLVAAMDQMLEKKDQPSLTNACKIVFDTIKENINIQNLEEFHLSKDLRDQIMNFETSIGIDNGKYYLLRATIGKDMDDKPFYLRKSFIMLVIFVLLVFGLMLFR